MTNEEKPGKNLIDLIVKIFPEKILKVLVGIALVFLIGASSYVVWQGTKGREAKIFGFGVGEDPYVSANIDATIEARIPTILSMTNSVITKTMTPDATLAPSQISTNTPTSITPPPTQEPLHPTYDFKNGCISDVWQEWPYAGVFGQNLQNGCNDFSGLGMIAGSEGLRIFSKPTEEALFGITTSLPDDDAEIRVKLQLKELSTNNLNIDSDLYIGFVNHAKTEPDGKFLVFRAYDANELPALIYGDYPETETINRILVNIVELEKEVTIIFQKNKLTIDMSIIGLGKPIELHDLPYNPKWDSFFIGYKMAEKSTLSAIIEDVQITER